MEGTVALAQTHSQVVFTADEHDVGAAVVIEVARRQKGTAARGSDRGQEAGRAAVLQRFDGQPGGNRLPALGPTFGPRSPQGSQNW